ncbi:ribulose-5-phosphate 4-epimerase/fuculose-1-phosphate aldolase [Alkalibacillus filiformis]|uniref:Ribulose-5-phosphate 4-epimerase/fuculose-1-phosphate aldolase n=1 Tax=Alkalibacillus filiformis TaxID=200990 RepID=A0ABU0DUT8_9BACI|nr:class II aldolase/adducin family protein [Alkalibacillus filiformis]MDQ0352046.1 ribulose-5-phosphate 4-epimerase/fuculose-1-phosphate aldolase [Alkalibacillus filiformis]
MTNEKVVGKGIKDYLEQPVFNSIEEERQHNKQKLAAAFRLFGKFGFSEGVAGHITYRDPELTDHLWVNPYGMHFNHIKASDLVLVNSSGEVVEGKYSVHKSAFAIHSAVHEARPDVVASAHAHSVYGKTWSVSGKLLDPLTQDACTFYNDHSIFDEYKGVALDEDEGVRIGRALGRNKAVILRSHGLLTVGQSVDTAAFWFITMERSCQSQLLAESAGIVNPIASDDAAHTASQVGREVDGWEGFQPLWQRIIKEEPELLN